MLQRPAHVPASIAAAPLAFPWDNALSLALDNPDNIPDPWAHAVSLVNYKGKAALGLACIEWVAWRLSGLTDVNDLLSRLEAAWASTAAVPYSRGLDYDGVTSAANTPGNPEGPRQLALIRIQDLHFAFKKGRQQMVNEAGKCALLASHVLPPDCGFEPWLRRALAALAANAPVGARPDRKVKVFDHGAERPVPRAWFESLAVPADADVDRAAWDDFLRALEPAANPYLVPADTLRAEGVVGNPYRMD
ncbi:MULTISPECIES: hypothetical protein [Myxococcus]|uniref:Uncharacterized protein n=1 Tax=Myxococcus llanfairpwllgwyngyllgogerychwyrndrobwllllantysiliogogogochensis TaxID=2590453 RepID=A0A540X6S5_9BACT|nr:MULTISPECIES: hypothetical protein [Myxococcus]NTX00182.1 hypothetical protein [Myxococcus sp. CA040A]TQF16912.1 hypothetical protein FJV41_05700 [Myxococcus llanfairpwllgwyngyllgogerychwyrndrobwllllantysiliogogogochensis]